MKILITPYNWMHNAAGGETYLYRLCQHLIKLGHEIKCIAQCDEFYKYGGIPVYPQGDMQRILIDNNDLFEWCDVVFTQLIGTNYCYNKVRQHKKPSVFFSHNKGRHYFLNPKQAVVYNSYAMGNLYPDHVSNILQPLVDYRDYKRSTEGKYIALINCCELKGVRQFIQLAEMLPQYQFLGIRGNYGTQITPDMPNVTWMDNGVITWDYIKILLVPSEIESWSQVATEAICNGIPVICSDLPGVRENLEDCALYTDRNNIPLYAERIGLLMEDSEMYDWYSELSIDRSKELDPIPRVKEFNEWLINFVDNQ